MEEACEDKHEEDEEEEEEGDDTDEHKDIKSEDAEVEVEDDDDEEEEIDEDRYSNTWPRNLLLALTLHQLLMPTPLLISCSKDPHTRITAPIRIL